MAKRKIADERLIAALLEAPTLDAAARLAGVSVRLLYKRRQDPEFSQKLKAAQAGALADTTRFLQHSTGRAALALVEIAENPEEPPAARVSAARALLEQAGRFTEISDFAERLAALEQMADKGDEW